MPSDPFGSLGEYVTANEAVSLASLLEVGSHTMHALRSVNAVRREQIGRLLSAAGLGHHDPAKSVAVLQAIAGAKATRRELTPVWTMPGNEASLGHLTGEFDRLVAGARISVTCATYNFTENSNMWNALKESSEQPGVVVCVYVDADKGEPQKVKAQLPLATVYKSAVLEFGRSVVSHAKFVVIDHELVLITSANFSYNAENRNVEFGILVQDSGLASSVERAISAKHGSLYVLVEG
ncbi:DISARM system phospholipase D-like protein DrmC [Rhodococcus sp. KRD162]|uniref:DISARM system phospholipase D-like protein DrmC n=1 Tax=Rhodococcus sp. KRD162 TaxID=2729725 RepID=UPI0019D0157B|nr:DISARM system phospholipase D-like protein DrmC [Rhodococcus sp. KRD162]